MRKRRRILAFGAIVLAVVFSASYLPRKLTRGMGILHLAASGGRRVVFETCMKTGCSPERRCRGPECPTNSPACLLMARCLLALGVKGNSPDEDGWTPLHWAAWAGNARMAALLLRDGADVRARARPMTGGMQVVDVLAAGTGSLWEGRAKRRHNTPLDVGIDFDQPAVLSEMLDSGVDANLLLDEASDWTLLQKAADVGAVGVTGLLLSRGAHVDAKDKDGQTALHLAAAAGRASVAELLLKDKAAVNARDDKGWTPLWRAVSCGALETAKVLLDHRADVNAKDARGRTPLYPALEQPEKGIVKLLLDRGAEVNVRDSAGQTPLHHLAAHACGSTGVEKAKLLLAQGADLRPRDNSGATPFGLAVKVLGNHDLVAFLEEEATRP